jgi:NAD(P)-dependent dehydrogenase (short-subunit alcohol dehydrogenase family)
MASLTGKTAFVTGGAQGIGRATAQLLARNGARVLVADISEESGARTATSIREEGGEGYFVRCDVSNERDVEEAIAAMLARFGRLDCAVNNAGTEGIIADTASYPLATFDRVVSLNLRGVFVCMQQELRAMLAGGGGSIVNLGSVVSQVGAAKFSAYNATKHAVAGLTRTAALEYARSGIRVNAVGPGFCETPMVTDRGLHARPGTDIYNTLESLHPMGRLGRPHEIAEAIAWLCSDAASFVTGHVLYADGGFLAQ